MADGVERIFGFGNATILFFILVFLILFWRPFPIDP